MDVKQSVALALGIGTLLVGVVDITLIYRKGYDQSITSVIRQWSHDMPIIPFAVGVLMGHLFWGK